MTRGSPGFTLIEVVVTVSLLAVIGAVAGIFLKPAIDSYFATQRRAELSDVTDTSIRRMVRDIRLALPNSLRTSACGAGACVELLLTRTGARYRSANDANAGTTEDVLDFTAADTAFDTLGPMSAAAGQVIQTGNDRVVVHNLGIAGANAYNGDNTSLITGFATPSGSGIASEDRITMDPKLFPLESPGRRFQVISGPVTFECTPGAPDANGNGTGSLRRWHGYAIQAAQPAAPPGGAVTAVLANYVTTCELDYTTLALQARGLVAIRIGVTRGGDTVTLYHEAHVNNVP